VASRFGEITPTRKHDVVLIVGSAPCVFEDIEKFNELGVEHDTICINASLEAWGKECEHWCALDIGPMFGYAKLIKTRYPNIVRHAPDINREKYAPFYDVFWQEIGIDGGTSGKFAVDIAIELGYKKIIIVGIPLSEDGKHFNDQADSVWQTGVWAAWANFASSANAEKVKAYSGFTKKLFGEPYKEWLNSYLCDSQG
jgi:hypothetical protein